MMQKSKRMSVSTDNDTIESDVGELHNAMNLTAIMTREKKKLQNNRDLQELVDSVTKDVQTKYRKSIIRRAVHPTLVCSTPFPNQATHIPNEIASLSFSSFGSDHPKNDQDPLDEKNQMKQSVERAINDINDIISKSGQSMSKNMSLEEVIEILQQNSHSDGKPDKIGLSSNSKTMNVHKEKAETTMVQKVEESKHSYDQKELIQTIASNATNLSSHCRKKGEREKEEDIRAIPEKSDYRSLYEFKKNERIESDEEELSSDKYERYKENVKKKERRTKYKNLIVTEHRRKQKRNRPISETRSSTSTGDYIYVTDESEDDCESLYRRRRRKSKYAAAIPLIKKRTRSNHELSPVPAHRKMKFKAIEKNVQNQKMPRKSCYVEEFSDSDKKSKKYKICKHRSVSRHSKVRYLRKVSSSSGSSEEESKIISETEMAAQRYQDDEKALRYGQKLRRTNFRKFSKSRDTQHYELYSPERRYTHRHEDVGKSYGRRTARLSRKESFDLRNKMRNGDNFEEPKTNPLPSEVELSDKKLVEIFKNFIRNALAANTGPLNSTENIDTKNNNPESLSRRKNAIIENIAVNGGILNEEPDGTILNCSSKVLFEKSMNLQDLNSISIDQSCVDSLPVNYNNVRRMNRLARCPFKYHDILESSINIREKPKKSVEKKKLHNIVEQLWQSKKTAVSVSVQTSLHDSTKEKSPNGTSQKKERFESMESNELEEYQPNNYDEVMNMDERNVIILQNVTVQRKYSDANKSGVVTRRNSRQSSKKTPMLPEFKSLPVENDEGKSPLHCDMALNSELKPEITEKKSPEIVRSPMKRYESTSTKLFFAERGSDTTDSGIKSITVDAKKKVENRGGNKKEPPSHSVMVPDSELEPEITKKRSPEIPMKHSRSPSKRYGSTSTKLSFDERGSDTADSGIRSSIDDKTTANQNRNYMDEKRKLGRLSTKKAKENMVDNKNESHLHNVEAPNSEFGQEITKKRRSPEIPAKKLRSPTKRCKLSSTKLLFEESGSEDQPTNSGTGNTSIDAKAVANQNRPQFDSQDFDEKIPELNVESRPDHCDNKESSEKVPVVLLERLVPTVELKQTGKSCKKSEHDESKDSHVPLGRNVHSDKLPDVTSGPSNSFESCNMEILEENPNNTEKKTSGESSDDVLFRKPKGVPKKSKKRNESSVKQKKEKSKNYEETEGGTTQKKAMSRQTTKEVHCDGLRRSTRERKSPVSIVEMLQLPPPRTTTKAKPETAKKRGHSRTRPENGGKVKKTSKIQTTVNISSQPVESNDRSDSRLSIEPNTSRNEEEILIQQELHHVLVHPQTKNKNKKQPISSESATDPEITVAEELSEENDRKVPKRKKKEITVPEELNEETDNEVIKRKKKASEPPNKSRQKSVKSSQKRHKRELEDISNRMSDNHSNINEDLMSESSGQTSEELKSEKVEKSSTMKSQSQETEPETSNKEKEKNENNCGSIVEEILSKMNSKLERNKRSYLALTDRVGFLSLAPNDLKNYTSAEFDQVFARIRGTNSLKLGHLFANESPSVFIVPKGVRTEIRNTGKEIALFLVALA